MTTRTLSHVSDVLSITQGPFPFNNFKQKKNSLFTEPVLKAKWKGLRDTFRAELKKELVYQKSNYHRNRPVWIHFKSLQFLKEQMVPRPPIWERNCSRNSDNDRSIKGKGKLISSVPKLIVSKKTV